MSLRTLGFGSILALVCLSASPLPEAQQIEPAPGTRIALYPGLPAIDRGLKADDLASAVRAPAEFVFPEDDRPYVPGRVIVKFGAGMTPAALAAVARSVGAQVHPPLSYANFTVLDIDPDADPEELARVLSARGDVEYAQAAYKWELHFKPNDPMYSSQWNFPAIDMERAWDINQGASPSVTVAVLDSGIAFENIVIRYNTRPINVIFPDGTRQTVNHGTIDVPYAAASDLAGPDRFVAPFDFSWNDRHPLDTLGHGTHVAGTIGQLTNNGIGVAGMAFNVKIMPVKIGGGGNWDFFLGAPFTAITDDQVARAIRYAADNGAKAMNMSFGRGGPPAQVVEDAVRYAVSRGVFCAISAGNGGNVGSPLEVLGDIASRVDGAIAVGAVGRNLNRAPYSSRGSWVEISAPGGDVSQGGITGAILQQTLDASLFASPFVPPRFDGIIFGYNQGTSMAAPHVTGFAALLIQQGITNPAAIEAAMKRFATDRGPAGRDDEYGAGVINPRATLRGLGVAK